MKQPDNIDQNCEKTTRADSSEAPTETNGSYYYDDSTGYEVVRVEDDDEEETEPSEKKLDDK